MFCGGWQTWSIPSCVDHVAGVTVLIPGLKGWCRWAHIYRTSLRRRRKWELEDTINLSPNQVRRIFKFPSQHYTTEWPVARITQTDRPQILWAKWGLTCITLM